MSAQLGGEDPTDPDRGDSGDAAAQLEGLDDLARTDQRIDEIQRLIAGSGVPDAEPGLADGTVVTLRFPDGDVATFRIVAILEEAPSDGGEDVVTVDSPLGRALVGRGAGDPITYAGPGRGSAGRGRRRRRAVGRQRRAWSPPPSSARAYTQA